MELDIRIAIGFMFTMLGALLSIFGLFTANNTTMYIKSLSININLWSGLIMLIFGLLMLFFGLKSKKSGD